MAKSRSRRSRSAPRPIRQGTKRFQLVQLISRKGGASMQQIVNKTEWDAKTALDAIRLARVARGYNIVKKGDRYFCSVKPLAA